jgi:hypothetical protein
MLNQVVCCSEGRKEGQEHGNTASLWDIFSWQNIAGMQLLSPKGYKIANRSDIFKADILKRTYTVWINSNLWEMGFLVCFYYIAGNLG